MILARLTQNIENTSQTLQENTTSDNSNQSSEEKTSNFIVNTKLSTDLFSLSERKSFERFVVKNDIRHTVLPESSKSKAIIASGAKTIAQEAPTVDFSSDEITTRSQDNSSTNPVFPDYGLIDLNVFNIFGYGNNQTTNPGFAFFGLNNNNKLFNNQKVLSIEKVSLLLESDRRLNNKEEIKILSHENVKVLKKQKSPNSPIRGYDTNLMFVLDQLSSDVSFDKIRNREIDKCESIFDRFVLYTNVNDHSNIAEQSISKAKNIMFNLDKSTTFANRLETEINYGNIVENFIVGNNSKYNGKIINAIFKNNNKESLSFLINKSGFDDIAFFDKQSSIESSLLTLEDLRIFYENISGFSFREKNYDFFGSLLNSTIINSDELVGQLMLNQAIAMYSFYPNTDNIDSVELFNSRQIINTNALTRYPIVQLSHLNTNSRILNNPVNFNEEIVNISNGSFRSDTITIRETNYLDHFIDNLTDRRYGFFIDKNDIFFQSPDFVNLNDTYRNRLSVAGKGSLFSRNQNIQNNNVVNIIVKSQRQTLNWTEFVPGPKVFERLYTDLQTNMRHRSPTFIIFPERYFSNQFTGDNDSSRNSSQEIFSTKINDFFLKKDDPIDDDDWLDSFYINNVREHITGIYYILLGLKGSASSNSQINLEVDVTSLNDNSTLIEEERKFDVAIKNNKTGILEYEFNRQIGGDYYSQFLESQRELAVQAQVRAENEALIGKLNNAYENSILSLQGAILIEDFFVFNTSNTFIETLELKNYSFKNRKPDIFNDRNTIFYLKPVRERLLNYNSEDTTSTSTTSFIAKTILSNSNTNYTNFSFAISNFVNLFKDKVGKEYTQPFREFLQKCQSKLNAEYQFVLLYGNNKETSIDTFEESPFIFDKKSYKNNFVTSFADVKNSSSNYYNQEMLSKKHIFSSERYREFLSKIYTNSFARDKSTVFKRIISDNVKIFEKGEYLDDSYFGFDVLLATALLDKNSNDVDNINKIVKMILSNALMKMSGLHEQISGLNVKPETLNQEEKVSSDSSNYEFYKHLEKVYSKSFAKEITRLIYNQKNIHCQKNYVFRNVKSFKDSRNLLSSITTTDGDGGITFNIADGFISTLTFPLKKSNFDLPQDIVFTSNRKSLTSNSEDVVDRFKDSLALLGSVLAYDYDIYINKKETGICFYEQTEDNKLVGKGYSYLDNLNNTTGDLKISYLNYKKPTSRYTGDGTLINKIRVEPDLPYKDDSVIIPFSYFYLAEKSHTFSNLLTQICFDIMKIFNVETSNFNNISDVLSFIDQNEFFIKTVKDILKAYASVFLDSYENYLTIIINKIKNSGDCITTFVGVNDNKKMAVSDIKKILNIITDEEKSLKQSNLFYDLEQFRQNRSDQEIYTKRSVELQNSYKILNNCDISNALCHDIIHGYFLNFEDNLTSRNKNIEEFNESVDKIIEEANRIEGFDVSKEDFISLIKDEFYQNYLSKEVQEKIFYKNLFSETFIKNNNFRNNLDKYKNLNVFNGKKLFYENKFKSFKKGLQYISETKVLGNNVNNLDIIKIPISFKTAKKIGPRGLLKINILPVNLKFPEIEYQSESFYYCPLLTNVTSNFSNADSFQDSIGFFNDTQKLSERYSVVNIDTALFEVNKVVEEIMIRKSLSIDSSLITQISNKAVTDARISSSLKDINFVTQSPLDENVKDVDFDVSNLIDTKTLSLISSLKLDDLIKIFDDYKSNINDFNTRKDNIINLDQDLKMINMQEFYKKFLLNLDEETSITNIAKSLVPNIYYDVFSIAINRKLFAKADDISAIRIRNSNIESLQSDSDKSYNYYISIEVL